MNEPALRVAGLVAGYVPEVDILCGVGLEVRRGEIVTVLGPNGAGKSTLIKTFAGLVSVRAGKVHLLGRDITGASAPTMAQSGLAYVPPPNNIFLRLRIAENLEMGAYVHWDWAAIKHIGGAQWQERV